MTEKSLRFHIDSGIARITLNRPSKLNALTRDLMIDLGAAVAESASRQDVRVISLSGTGRAFSAGQDLSERDPRKLDGPLDLAEIQREIFHPVVKGLIDAPKPVVACVTGVAAGAGAGIALAADIVVASETAKFVFSFAKIGLSVDAGLGRALARGLGIPRAKALLMLGESLSASEAAEAGLIWRALPDDELAEQHEALLRRLAETPRESLIGIKAALSKSHLDVPDYLEAEAQAQGRAGSHPDYAEGVLSFLERRAPRFS